MLIRKNIDELEKDILSLREKNIYVSGFDEFSKHIMWWLADKNVRISGFIAGKDECRVLYWLNKRVFSYEESLELEGVIIDHVQNEHKRETLNHFKEKYPVHLYFEPFALNYLIWFICKQQKRIILYGSAEDAIRMNGYLSLFEICVEYAVVEKTSSERGKSDRTNELVLRDRYDLLYENVESICVLVLPGNKQSAERFAVQTGIDLDIFMCAYHDKYLGPMKISHYECLDPNLGYCSIVEGSSEPIILKKDSMKDQTRAIRVAVLGGSTSDVDLYTEKTWMEWLIDIAAADGVRVDVICAAVDGYTAAQELIRLERDIIPMQPDMVISYSRLNQYGSINRSDPRGFIHKYQHQIFERFSKALSGRDEEYMKRIVNIGSKDPESGEWICLERMMKAVCEEYNIKFYGVIQPCLWEKKRLSNYEKELMECFDWKYLNPHMIFMNDLRRRAENMSFSWMINAADVFDEVNEAVYFDLYHVVSMGNKIVAERIYEKCFK